MPRQKQYEVHLTSEEQASLQQLTKKGQAQARTLTRAHILLLASQDKQDRAVAAALSVHPATVGNIRKRFAQAGLSAALKERPRPGRQAKLDGKQEAFMIALACSDPPRGREHWTMQLLADRLVTMGVVAAISDETVRRVLKKTRSSRGRKSSGVSAR